MKIPEQVSNAFYDVDKLVFGTANKNGAPNLILLGSRRIVNDDTIWIFDTRFGKTKKNLLENSNVSICVWHGPDNAFQIKGTATYLSEGKKFEDAVKWVVANGKKKSTKGLVEIKVKEIYHLNTMQRLA
jgi:predicted pyridoxine 5'-phosphate oxidase superfamily flavin-nucleotide-binding protein